MFTETFAPVESGRSGDLEGMGIQDYPLALPRSADIPLCGGCQWGFVKPLLVLASVTLGILFYLYKSGIVHRLWDQVVLYVALVIFLTTLIWTVMHIIIFKMREFVMILHARVHIDKMHLPSLPSMPHIPGLHMPSCTSREHCK
mmetsp:Transcript_67105/g.187751  ORF Transcript_67105/g.187751 Transcript_67105/m.187751 type:complete len:144 (-) Transcript_67105:188-619(-)